MKANGSASDHVKETAPKPPSGLQSECRPSSHPGETWGAVVRGVRKGKIYFTRRPYK